jgi:sugar phosphate isomerase/epimerase
LGDEVRAALQRLAAMGYRAVQLSAAQRGLRPADLDRSARRDLLATLRRIELAVSGIDVWIPPADLLDAARCDRALGAVRGAIELAADLGRCPVSLILPHDDRNPRAIESRQTIIDSADRHGVALADHAISQRDAARFGIGIDPAAWLGNNLDPVEAVLRAGQAGRLESVRISDLDTAGFRCPPGTPGGRLDLLAYRVTVATSGFEKAVIVDARQWTDPWSGLRGAMDAWTNALKQA